MGGRNRKEGVESCTVLCWLFNCFVRLIPRDLATECILLYVFERESGLDDLHLLTALLVLCHVGNRDGNGDIDFYMEGRNDGTKTKVCDK